MLNALSNKHQTIVKRAFRIKEAAQHSYHKLGCVIFDKGILSIGFNYNKTCPNLPGEVNKLHAEMAAIKYAECDLKRSTLVIVRGSISKPLLAKPCQFCMLEIKKAGIKRVIYSTSFGYEIVSV